jgi:hypothetical protein
MRRCGHGRYVRACGGLRQLRCADQAAFALAGFMQKPLRLDALRQALATTFV